MGKLPALLIGAINRPYYWFWGDPFLLLSVWYTSLTVPVYSIISLSIVLSLFESLVPLFLLLLGSSIFSGSRVLYRVMSPVSSKVIEFSTPEL
jgi:hypothetical protein